MRRRTVNSSSINSEGINTEDRYSSRDQDDNNGKPYSSRLRYTFMGITAPKASRGFRSLPSAAETNDQFLIDKIWSHREFGLWSFAKVGVFIVGGLIKMVTVYMVLKKLIPYMPRVLFTVLSSVPLGVGWALLFSMSTYGAIEGLSMASVPAVIEILIFVLFFYFHSKAKAVFEKLVKHEEEQLNR